MHVAVIHQRFPDREPYTEAVTDAGGTISYHDCETEADVINVCTEVQPDILVTFKAPISEAVLDVVPNAALCIRLGSGYDNIDVAAASARGIPVANVQGYADADVASHAIALMFAAAHDVVVADREVRQAPTWGERPLLRPMTGGVFGIVGLGRIGRTAAQYAQGLDMDVIAYDPYVDDDVFDAFGVERVAFKELLRRADCVSLHTPLTAETRGLFGNQEFTTMKDDAILVNTGRGPIVNEQALVEAVEAGEIYAAGIDVFEQEPPRETSALECERIVCSPHHAGFSPRAHDDLIELVSAELVRVICGEHPQHCVNPDVFQQADKLINPERKDWDVSDVT